MMSNMKNAVVFGLCIVSMAKSDTYNLTHAMNLEDDLKNGYYKSLRPQAFTYINLGVGLFHINELNIVSQKIDIVGFFYMAWHDSRLTWTPSSYGYMNETTILHSDIWTPPLVLNNAADGPKIFSDDSSMTTVYATVTYDGSVGMGLAIQIVAQCIVNVEYYPFDTQECYMIMTPWSYTASQVGLVIVDPEVTLDIYEENGEWEIIEAKVSNFSRFSLGKTFSAAKMTLSLRRKYSYYLINMILPVVFLAILGTMVFILPVESGEKNGFSLTILLSLSVVMTVLSDSIPAISTQTCRLSIYLLVVFILCSLETGLTVFSCQIHNYTASGFTPGEKVQKIMRRAAKVSFFRRPCDNNNSDSVKEVDKNSDKTNDKSYISPSSMEKQAWKEKEEKEKEDTSEEYSYEDCAFVFDRIGFVIFFFLNLVITLSAFISIIGNN